MLPKIFIPLSLIESSSVMEDLARLRRREHSGLSEKKSSTFDRVLPELLRM
jgi:hypothetical protein